MSWILLQQIKFPQDAFLNISRKFIAKTPKIFCQAVSNAVLHLLIFLLIVRDKRFIFSPIFN